jgi:hypothetical protein
VLAEAAQELACGERHDALLVAVCVVFQVSLLRGSMHQ